MQGLSKEVGVIYLLDKPYREPLPNGADALSLFESKQKEELRSKGGYYNIGWSNQLHKILSSKKIDSEEVQKFKEISKSELFLDADWFQCGHAPAYAIELFSNDMLYFKTSFCFACDTWINEVAGGFVRLRLSNKNLFSWLNQIIPLPDGYGEA